ncbi:MAG: hypothetical protein V4675_04770 [Verrucomicrobiota bacterium]
MVIGLCTFWIFGLGFWFFGVADILAIVAMCTHQVKQGLLLLAASFASAIICALLFFVLALGTVGVVAVSAAQNFEHQQAATSTAAKKWDPSVVAPQFLSPVNVLRDQAMLPMLEDMQKNARKHVPAPAEDYNTQRRRKELQELRARQGSL